MSKMFDDVSKQKSASGFHRRIDFFDVVEEISKHWFSILLITLSVWMLAYTFLSWRQQSFYESSATISISNYRYADNVDTFNMLAYSTDVSKKINSVLESKEFKDAVAADLGYSGFRGSLKIEPIGDSSLTRITVQTQDSETAYHEVRSILKNAADFSKTLIGGVNIRAIEQPAMQEKPRVSGNFKNWSVVAAVAALFAVCFILAFFSLLKNSVTSGLEVTESTGAEFLGAIYRSVKRERGEDVLINSPKADQRYVESIRKLANHIAGNMSEQGQKVLLISSPENGTGKSIAAANLSMALAQQGKKVILADMDFSNPSVSRLFDATNGRSEDILAFLEKYSGSTAHEMGEGLGYLLSRVPNSNLSIVTCNKLCSFASDRYGTEISNLFAALKEEADYVIVDTAPISQSSDAEILSGIADTSILVIRRQKDELSKVAGAYNVLNGNENVLGFVLSNVRKYSACTSVTECRKFLDDKEEKSLVDRSALNVIEVNLARFLKDLQKDLLSYGVLLLAVMILFAGIFYTYGKRSKSSTYTAYSTFTASTSIAVKYKFNNQKNTTNVLVGKMLPAIITSSAMKELVKEDLGYAQSESLPVSIKSSVVLNTNLVSASVSSSDAQLSYDTLQSIQRNVAEIADDSMGAIDLDIVDESGVPSKSSGGSGNGKKLAAAGGLLGLILGLAVLVGRLILRDTVLLEEDITRRLKAKCFGIVPWTRIKRGKDQASVGPNIEAEGIPKEFTRGIFSIRYRVEKEAQQNGIKSVLVTSAIRAEGKTTVACNLALALANHGYSVLLIDADLRNPSVLKAIGMEPCETGLVDVLSEKSALENALRHYSGNQKLTVLPGGKTCDNPSQLWGAKGADQLIKRACDQYDFVIIDAPQSTVVSETALLAKAADTSVFVVREDHAKLNQICEGFETLEEASCGFLGCVLRN